MQITLFDYINMFQYFLYNSDTTLVKEEHIALTFCFPEYFSSKYLYLAELYCKQANSCDNKWMLQDYTTYLPFLCEALALDIQVLFNIDICSKASNVFCKI